MKSRPRSGWRTLGWLALTITIGAFTLIKGATWWRLLALSYDAWAVGYCTREWQTREVK